MQRQELTKKIILDHYDRAREVTNNLLFANACTTEDNDKRVIFPAGLASSMGWNPNIISMYDYRMMYPGVYDRLYQVCVISLCSDIEFLFKEIFDAYGYQKGKGTGFFQRFDDVISTLSTHGMDFSNVSADIDNLKRAFQIRHIGIHNMGFADVDFVAKTGRGNIGIAFIITQSDFRQLFDSYESLLKHLDSNLS